MVKRVLKKALAYTLTAAAPLCRRVSTRSEEDARNHLSRVSPKPSGSALTENQITEASCDLQIIIPAYNVENYLSACMDSVLSQQTKYQFRVILIDDGSTDQTPAIADKYTADQRVQVIHQQNRGFSGARNVGLETLFGRYIMFVDSDDLLCPGAVEALLDTAYQHDCDVAEGGAWYLTGEETSLMYRYSAVQQVSPGITFHGQPWAKVYRAELFSHLCFPEGFWYEDSILAFLVWPRVRSAYTVPEMAYIHRRNPAGITTTSQGRPKSVDTYWITETLISEQQAMGIPMSPASCEQLLEQIHLNQNRVQKLDEATQESLFVLTCALVNRMVPADWESNQRKNLLNALRNRNFGAYRLCCHFY